MTPHTTAAADAAAQRTSAFALIAAALMCDGLDTQILSVTLPSIMREWQLPKEAFAAALTAGLLGAAIGTATGGMLGDRFGRKRMLVLSVALFGMFTALVTISSGLNSLTALRFAAGLGLGAAMPNAAASLVELANPRRAAMVVTAGVACVPLGGLLGGLGAGALLQTLGWRTLFEIGGGFAIVIAVLMAVALPETLHLKPRDATGESMSSEPLRASHLLGDAHRRNTLAFMCASITAMFGFYTLLSWTPATLASAGYDLAFTSYAMAAINVGGVSIALLSAWCISRFGSLRLVLVMTTIGAAAAFGAAFNTAYPQLGAFLLIALLILQGGCVGGICIVMYPIVAHAYPIQLRASGLGWTVAIGRCGAVISPIIGAMVMMRHGAPSLYLMIGMSMLACFAAMASARTHIPPRVKVAVSA